MEGRSAVLQAPYWIGVRTAIMLGRKIRQVNESSMEKWRFVKANLQERASKKNFYVYHYKNRTANRHRCSGRVAQGERVRDPQGTRQKSGRTLAIRPALSNKGRRELFPGDCLPKTQLPANT